MACIDEHLMMMLDQAGTSNDRPYYYVQDRLYNVWAMIDRAGAIVEGWCGHSARRRPYVCYGHLARFPCIASALPLIRESAGRGDLPWTRGLARSARDRAAIRGLRPPPRVQGMDNDTLIDADPDPDKTRFFDARDGVIWDPRADMDAERARGGSVKGDVDDDDVLLWSDADNVWPESEPTVAQAFSDVGNPFMFQGVPRFALDTADDAETATLPLNHHRARFADPVTGRWVRRDPLSYAMSVVVSDSKSAPRFMTPFLASISDQNAFQFVRSRPVVESDQFGLLSCEPDGPQVDRPWWAITPLTEHPACERIPAEHWATGTHWGIVVCDGNGGAVICVTS